MSNPLDPRWEQPMPPEPPRPGGKRPVFLSVLMVIAGLILLLPGLCALIFSGLGGGGGGMAGILLVCMLISAGGVALIVKAFR